MSREPIYPLSVVVKDEKDAELLRELLVTRIDMLKREWLSWTSGASITDARSRLQRAADLKSEIDRAERMLVQVGFTAAGPRPWEGM